MHFPRADALRAIRSSTNMAMSSGWGGGGAYGGGGLAVDVDAARGDRAGARVRESWRRLPVGVGRPLCLGAPRVP